ncbi:MAG: sn-glycerol-1-phosphate dehydrogenase [Clostridiales bacterium]|nr:sn-glycerol-1-phosphate dehydrogenase [Clostridiales bacterium]
MQELSKLSLEELKRPEGFDCRCGRHHAVTLKYLKIGRGAIGHLPEALKAVGAKKPFLVSDENTFEAAGARAEEILHAAGVPFVSYVIPCRHDKVAPSEWEVGSIAMHFDPSCDFILGIGSGVVNDLCKVFAHASGRESGIVGTAPSMDGFASNSSSMEVNGVKATLYNKCPALVLCDTEIMAKAPMRMLWAGLGDMAAKYTSICEWRIANIVIGEYYCEEIAEMVRASLRKIMAAAPGIAKRDPDAVQSVAEGLVMTGMAMAFAQVSRPASGLEHYFSHVWEMLALERKVPYDLHGIQVGVGTMLTMDIFEELKKIRPDRAVAEKHMRAFDARKWEAEIRRIFGATTGEILRIEQKFRKNDPASHAERLNVILDRWEEILRAVDEELPELTWLENLLKPTGMPLTPEEISVPRQDVRDAFVGSRDIRDKYLVSTLIWDLGRMDEFAERLLHP